jgi:hypothetical protein
MSDYRKHPRTLHQIINEPQHDAHVCVWDKMLQDNWEAKQLAEMSGDVTPAAVFNKTRDDYINEILRKHGITSEVTS